MSKRLTKIGSSHGIIVDKPILEMLGITEETDLDLRTDGQNLIVVPRRSAEADATFKAAYRHVATKHRSVLKKLAK
jgi:antitoxin component of MazEF toxin-antitoxin module